VQQGTDVYEEICVQQDTGVYEEIDVQQDTVIGISSVISDFFFKYVNHYMFKYFPYVIWDEMLLYIMNMFIINQLIISLF
jgi:hypothetical protein